MEAVTGSENSQLFVHLAHSYGALVISLIERVRHECPLMQESFRRALVPLYQALGNYLGQPPFEDYTNSLSQSFNIRDAPQSYRTLPSIPAPVRRTRTQRFAIIIHLLTAMLTTENSALEIINQFVDDPIFRERLLAELDELRTLVEDHTATVRTLEN
ncbi:uncharacterized protein LOC128278933 [Anopheles cruzii]|uniref:uncharacterized protein LOC128278933 n=1 Tax=Anopheles cruzii TaxID=68878 RepID=UPI0022EC6123|nr:uncharacterized protein LOC128278933 [Anopheles cruzii]